MSRPPVGEPMTRSVEVKCRRHSGSRPVFLSRSRFQRAGPLWRAPAGTHTTSAGVVMLGGVPEGRTDRLTDRVLALALGGASLRDLARECGVSYETVRRWVERGRGEWEALSVCGRLAAALELRALAGRFVPQGELEPGELRLLVSRAARAGDVRAMKLAVELGLGGDSSRDELAELVGEVVPLPQRRERGGGGRAA